MSKDFLFCRQPIEKLPTIVRGEGIYLYDDRGNRYMDACGSVKVVSIGYGVKEVADAIAEQARQLTFVYTGLFVHPAEVRLAEEIMHFAPSGMGKVYFASGGSEAGELAIKFARQYHLARGNRQKWKVIGRWQSYHGATIGVLSIGGQTNRRRDYEPYLLGMPHIYAPYCYRCPFGKNPDSCSRECATSLEKQILQDGPE